jgi:hypothetical protein
MVVYISYSPFHVIKSFVLDSNNNSVVNNAQYSFAHNLVTAHTNLQTFLRLSGDLQGPKRAPRASPSKVDEISMTG